MKGVEKDQNRFATTRWRKFSAHEVLRQRKAPPPSCFVSYAGYEDVLREHKTSYTGPIMPYWESLHILCDMSVTQNNTNPYLNKEKVKLYLHLSTVSDVLEYCLRITAFCLFLKTSISLRLRLNPENTNIILLHEKFLKFDWLRAVIFQLNLKYLHVNITKQLMVVV